MVKIKKRPFSVAVGILGILTAILIIVVSLEKGEDKNKALYINDDAVTAEEYAMLAEEYCNQIYMKYSTEQVNSESFWEEKIDGIAPYTLLEEIILEELKNNYALKNLAVELGITEDYTYEQLLEAMHEENASKENLSDDEASYGLNNYDISTYYKYWYSNLETQVRNALIQKEMNITEEECKAYYENNIDAYSYDVAVDILYAEIVPDSEAGKNNTRNIAYQLSRAMEVMNSAEELKKQEMFSDIDIQELSLNSLDTQGGMSGVYLRRWEIASNLLKGEVYGPYEDNGRYCVIKCIEHMENSAMEFDAVYGQIERYLQVEEAKKLINNEVKNLKITEVKNITKEIILKTLN